MKAPHGVDGSGAVGGGCGRGPAAVAHGRRGSARQLREGKPERPVAGQRPRERLGDALQQEEGGGAGG